MLDLPANQSGESQAEVGKTAHEALKVPPEGDQTLPEAGKVAPEL